MDAYYVGHFRLISNLGSGRLGTVYKAYDESLCRHVALKVLHEDFREHNDVLEQFILEAQTAASITHPNVAKIYFCGVDRGLPYMAMELAEGNTLHSILSTHGKLPEETAIAIAIETAKGLEAGHRIGLTHSDIKPANLVLTETQQLKILDFGINRVSHLNSKVMHGQSLYLPPESQRGFDQDPRVDIYSLGATFFHTVTGHLPPKNHKTTQLILRESAHEQLVVERKNQGRIHNKTTQIISRMMHPDKSHRYNSYGEILTDLYVAKSAAVSGEDIEMMAQSAPRFIVPDVDTSRTVRTRKTITISLPAPELHPATETHQTPRPVKKGQEQLGILLVCCLILILAVFAFSNSIPDKFKLNMNRLSTSQPKVPTPFYGTSFSIPGRIEAEDFDNGGPGVAYQDFTPFNEGNIQRVSEGVDIVIVEQNQKNFAVGYAHKGEWILYSVNVTKAGSYDVILRVAHRDEGGVIHLEFDGVNKTGPIAIPQTGGWTAWKEMRIPNIQLNAGEQKLRMIMDAESTRDGNFVGNIDRIEFVSSGNSPE